MPRTEAADQRAVIWAALGRCSQESALADNVIVSGTVFDPSNAILYGASVTLTAGKEDVLRTTTDAKVSSVLIPLRRTLRSAG